MKKILNLFLVIANISFALEATETICPPEETRPKFDFSLSACLNYYADLGFEKAKVHCKTLSGQFDFTNQNFSKCNELFQLSRMEWSSKITDKCLNLVKNNSFVSPSFESCLEIFSISSSSVTKAEKKLLRRNAAEKCLIESSKKDFSSPSFQRCFYLYGGNYHPLKNEDATFAHSLAIQCAQESEEINFSSREMLECWDKYRREEISRITLVKKCIQEIKKK